jgi:small subunit ribosomal protein S16
LQCSHCGALAALHRIRFCVPKFTLIYGQVLNACRRAALRAIIVGFLRPVQLFGIIMVVIRLARGGAKKRPFFNIVATDSRNRRDGRFIERIGFYNPMASGAEVGLKITADRLAYWQGVGAQLSPTVARLVAQQTPAA